MKQGFVSSIYFAGEEWLRPAAIVFGVFLVIVALSYRRSPGGRGIRFACAALKIAGLALLLVCFLEPMWAAQRAKPGANLMAIIADNSRSMTARDEGASETRGATMAKSLADSTGGWRARLAQDFETRNYLADRRLLPTRDFHELAFDGESTRIEKTLAALKDRHRGQPLAGALFLTDGVVEDLPADAIAGLPPIYPVIFASDTPERDIAIGVTSVTQTAFEDAPVTIQSEIATTGFSGRDITARLFSLQSTANGPIADSKALVEQTISIPKDIGKVVARMQLRPAASGVSFYRLEVAPKDGDLKEALAVNNAAVIVVDRGSAQNRVLYVGGRPGWDFKFLNRALQADEQTQLVGLIRIAKREPKFEFRGRVGESSNPLFRGFGNQSKEEVERYDQPVLTRVGTEDQAELASGFPKRVEDLFRYRAVILDDLEAEFFSADQMALLEKFVSQRGGGLLMLGGAESFIEGKYERSRIGEMLPIYLRGNPDTRLTAPGEWHLALTREGWLETWARLRTGETEEKGRLSALPHFDVMNIVGTPKPGALVVARASNGVREVPAIVAQRYGRGRVAAMLIGDFFQSGLGDEAKQKDLGRAWRQLTRWMLADVPDRFEARAEETGDSIKLRVWARNEKFEPMENARVTLAISPTAEGTPPVLMPAEPSSSEAGLFEATFIPRVSGGYRVEATVEGEDGKVAGVAQTGWSTNLAASEFRDLRPNVAALERLAKQTGGRVVKAEELPNLVRDLPSERVPIMETWTQPLWHTPWVMLAALLCFVLEWGLRRRSGLA